MQSQQKDVKDDCRSLLIFLGFLGTLGAEISGIRIWQPGSTGSENLAQSTGHKTPKAVD